MRCGMRTYPQVHELGADGAPALSFLSAAAQTHMKATAKREEGEKWKGGVCKAVVSIEGVN